MPQTPFFSPGQRNSPLHLMSELVGDPRWDAYLKEASLLEQPFISDMESSWRAHNDDKLLAAVKNWLTFRFLYSYMRRIPSEALKAVNEQQGEKE